MTRVRSASLAVLCSVLILAGCGVEMKQGSQARNNRGVPQGPGALTGKDVPDRDSATAAASIAAFFGGAYLFRVHDVGRVKEALVVAEAMRSK